jgi:hypothetical protein
VKLSRDRQKRLVTSVNNRVLRKVLLVTVGIFPPEEKDLHVAVVVFRSQRKDLHGTHEKKHHHTEKRQVTVGVFR